MSHRVTALVGAAAALGALLLAEPPQAGADVSAACLAHLAEVKTHNTSPAADRRYHLKRGEHSPCTEEDARYREPLEDEEGWDCRYHGNKSCEAADSSGDRSPVQPPQESADRSSGERSDGKSRWCRRHWYC